MPYGQQAVEIHDATTGVALAGATAANLAATLAAGALVTIEPGNWTAVHAPAAAAQATATRATGGAGVRHVCTSISATVACGATAQTPLNVYLRDGATGAGTIIWAASLAAPANGSGVLAYDDLSIVGSANTAMTLEFSAAGVAASVEAVTLCGFDVS